MTAAIEVEDLRKTYRTPLSRKRVEALKGVSFHVEEGEIFGFLGPNGAGKTTTIRILMGLISASGGRCKIFDHTIPSRQARSRLGFLPEAPYFYDYLTVAELVDLSGRIHGMSTSQRRRRADELIELVGLVHARNQPLKSYSKGMLQRAGVAQALMSDPDLLVFDEPMSGLDPIGRKDIHDIIMQLRERKKTVFFCSHILADVETMANRIAIVAGGQIRVAGPLRELLDDTVSSTLVSFAVSEEDRGLETALSDDGYQLERAPESITVTVPPERSVDDLVRAALERGARLLSCTARGETLEDLFIRYSKAPPKEVAE